MKLEWSKKIQKLSDEKILVILQVSLYFLFSKNVKVMGAGRL